MQCCEKCSAGASVRFVPCAPCAAWSLLFVLCAVWRATCRVVCSSLAVVQSNCGGVVMSRVQYGDAAV